MIIECPSCGARAKLPDSKQGAKVRCVECDRIYVAGRRGGGGGRSKNSDATMPIIIGAAVVVLGLVLFFVMNRGDEAPRSKTELPTIAKIDTSPVVDETGWDSAAVKTVRELHDLAHEHNDFRLRGAVAFDRAWAAANEAQPADYEELDGGARATFEEETIAALISDDPENLVGQWIPFDGSVVLEEDELIVVRLSIQPREGGDGATRNIEWKLCPDPKRKQKWRVWSWERYISPEEAAANRRQVTKRTVKKTLSDGSKVMESVVRPLEHDPGTPPELRGRIDQLIERFCDPSLAGREVTKVRNELIAIGKPAIPALLNRFQEVDKGGYEEFENQIAGQNLHLILKDITGYETTFSAHAAIGATDERRESGVKQWFWWYDKRYKRFEGREEGEDLLEGAEIRSEAERRAIEKARKELEDENN